MKKKLVVVLLTAAMSMSLLAGCGGNSGSSDAKSDAKTEDTKEDSDQVAADKVAKLIDDIYVQETRQMNSAKKLRKPGTH